MKAKRLRRGLVIAGLGLALTGLTGCQTWVAGMTLPSGHYLEHRPQYFPPEPDFPLQRELNSMLAADRLAAGAGPAAPVGAPLEAPVVPGVGPGALPPAAGPAAPAGPGVVPR